MFIWAQIALELVGTIGMLIAVVVLKLGVRAAKNPESGLYKVYSVSLAIIRYPLWIFTALVGVALIFLCLSMPGAEGGILLGLFLLFVGLMGIVHAFKSHKSEKDE